MCKDARTRTRRQVTTVATSRSVSPPVSPHHLGNIHSITAERYHVVSNSITCPKKPKKNQFIIVTLDGGLWLLVVSVAFSCLYSWEIDLTKSIETRKPRTWTDACPNLKYVLNSRWYCHGHSTRANRLHSARLPSPWACQSMKDRWNQIPPHRSWRNCPYM